jgi:hypothetical protein
MMRAPVSLHVVILPEAANGAPPREMLKWLLRCRSNYVIHLKRIDNQSGIAVGWYH